MSNVIDITGIIRDKKDLDWYHEVIRRAKSATNINEQLHWLEIKLGIEFEQYYKKHGTYHPNDPANMDVDSYERI